MNSDSNFDKLFLDFHKKRAIKMYCEENKSIEQIKQYLIQCELKTCEIIDIIEVLRCIKK